MRFVPVNDRTPFRKISCALYEQIGEGGYLRDTLTRLYFCGAACYALGLGNCRDASLRSGQGLAKRGPESLRQLIGSRREVLIIHGTPA
jgi:hypothetical protein